jgi:hypothetical protein
MPRNKRSSEESGDDGGGGGSSGSGSSDGGSDTNDNEQQQQEEPTSSDDSNTGTDNNDLQQVGPPTTGGEGEDQGTEPIVPQLIQLRLHQHAKRDQILLNAPMCWNHQDHKTAVQTQMMHRVNLQSLHHQ